MDLAAGTIERKESGGRKQETGDRRGETGGRKEPRRQPKERTRESKPASPGLATQGGQGIEIVYSDDAVVVVNKPAGLTTMRHKEEAAEFGERGRKFLPTTLADLLPGLLGAPTRPVIAVHRIDRDTSGLVLFARNRATAENLMKQFRKHTVDRRYLCADSRHPRCGANRIDPGS